jgi:hypothetical protein
MRGRRLRAAVLLLLTSCVTATDTRGRLISTKVETDNCEAELRGTYSPQLAPTVQVIVKRHITCRKIDANTWEVVRSEHAGPGVRITLSAIAGVVTGVVAFFGLALALSESSQTMQMNGGGEQQVHDSEGSTIVLAGAGALALAAATVVYAGVGYGTARETTTEDVDRVIDGTVSSDELLDGTLSYGLGKTVALNRSKAELDVSELKNTEFWMGRQLVVFEETFPFDRLGPTAEKCSALVRIEPSVAAQYDADTCVRAGWPVPAPWVAWCKETCLHGVAKE